MATTTTPDVQALKDRHRATWAAGDYEAVAERLVLEIGDHLVARMGLGAGDEVLDVATGTGNAAIPAAAAGARVIGVDLVPRLLEAAARRAARAGVRVGWTEGDAEDLPFDDASFDVVLSTLGVQFAPRHAVTAGELVRVCRPGGRIGLCNWTPEGYIGRFFATIGPHMPPAPDWVSPPPLWGSEDHVRRLFAGTGVELAFDRRSVDFRHASPEAFIDFMAADYGPLVKARELLDPQGRWGDLRAELIALSERWDAADDDTFRASSEYLVVLGRRAG